MNNMQNTQADNLSDLIDIALSPLDSFIKIMAQVSDGDPSVEIAETLMDHAKLKINNITGFVNQKMGKIRLIGDPNQDGVFVDVDVMK